jgi:RNA polymerase sigma-70 factor, ECF subfamily
MDTTPVSLLERMRQPGDQVAWSRFVELATPLLFSWSEKMGLQNQDAQDLVQDVLAVLVRKLPEFQYDPQRSFRGWLRTVTVNKWRERLRGAAPMPTVDDQAELDDHPAPEPDDPFWEVEYREHIVARALEIMQTDFETTTWRACWEHVVSGHSAAEVAGKLGISIPAVYMAKSRVLKRLREELKGMME